MAIVWHSLMLPTSITNRLLVFRPSSRGEGLIWIMSELFNGLNYRHTLLFSRTDGRGHSWHTNSSSYALRIYSGERQLNAGGPWNDTRWKLLSLNSTYILSSITSFWFKNIKTSTIKNFFNYFPFVYCSLHLSTWKQMHKNKG